MPSFLEKKILPFSSQQVFELVTDIEAYPRFIEGCQDIRVLSQTQEAIVAQVKAGLGPFSETYECEIKSEPYSWVRVDYIKGPFQHLCNEWRFQEISSHQTQVDFYIDFAFQLKLYEMMMKGVFQVIVKKTILAFEREALLRFTK